MSQDIEAEQREKRLFLPFRVLIAMPIPCDGLMPDRRIKKLSPYNQEQFKMEKVIFKRAALSTAVIAALLSPGLALAADEDRKSVV